MGAHRTFRREFLIGSLAGAGLLALGSAAEEKKRPAKGEPEEEVSPAEDYHEKLEEEFLFPRFRRARKEVELVDVLQAQHLAGRRLTDVTLRATKAGSLKSADEKDALAGSLTSFVRMYEPHEAREDTILFPAFRKIVSSHEWDALGEDFEKREHQLFGSDGFERMVDRVAGIERKLGIYDLTPKA